MMKAEKNLAAASETGRLKGFFHPFVFITQHSDRLLEQTRNRVI
jgi:hypothetical protein